jgi:regulator of protease activity HflC (stomatin/prohibitin superfamily)
VLDKLIDFLISFIDLFRFWSILPPEQAGFVRRFGLPVRDLKPGLNFLWPFNIETTTRADMRQWSDVLPPQSLRTKDGVDVVVRLMVAYQVSNPRTFVLEVFDATNNIQDLAMGTLGSAVTRARSVDVFSGAVLTKVSDRITRAAKKWGIDVLKVQLTDATAAPSYRLFGMKGDEG